MSENNEPTPSQKSVRDLYANGTDPIAVVARYRDQIADLTDHLKSYRSLEQLVLPEFTDDTEAGVQKPRAEFNALLRVLTSQMQHQLDNMAKTALALQNELTLRAKE